MPKYAYFDSTKSAPQPVLGWYDTDDFTYANLPSANDLLEMTDAQWSARLSQAWAVNMGQFVAYSAPALTLAQQAAAAINAGLMITLSGTITLGPTLFPTDPITQDKIASVITTINTTESFPGGATSYPMKDSSGTWHTFNLAQYKAVAAEIASYVAPLDLIIDGNPLGATNLPANSVSLAV